MVKQSFSLLTQTVPSSIIKNDQPFLSSMVVHVNGVFDQGLGLAFLVPLVVLLLGVVLQWCYSSGREAAFACRVK